MKNLYSHYRKIKVSSRNGNKPEVQGYEEIWHNGQRQVRHWTDFTTAGKNFQECVNVCHRL